MNWRLVRYVIAHPVIAYRWHVAVNAPWPEVTS